MGRIHSYSAVLRLSKVINDLQLIMRVPHYMTVRSRSTSVIYLTFLNAPDTNSSPETHEKQVALKGIGMVSPWLRPKWYSRVFPIKCITFDQGPIVHYIGNRVPFGMQTGIQAAALPVDQEPNE